MLFAALTSNTDRRCSSRPNLPPSLSDRLGNDEADRVSVMSDVESVLTHYCKSQRDTYRRGNGWMELLQPLVPLKLNKPELYFTLTNILQRYIPK